MELPARAADLAAIALPAAQADPLAAAVALVKFAVDAGGVDNITAVLAPFPPVWPESLYEEIAMPSLPGFTVDIDQNRTCRWAGATSARSSP